MAELRSFIIGVTIAGAILLVAGLAFGLFSSNDSNSPSVRLLGTPPATRTPAPGATRSPDQFTPVAPTATSGAPADQTPGTPGAGTGTPDNQTPATGQTPAVTNTPTIQTATPTLETAPTAVPTATPQIDNVAIYVDAANQYTPGLVGQIDYLVGNVNAPNITSAEWRDYTVQSAQTIQSLASSLGALSAPACVSAAHGSLVSAANQASAAAGQVIAAVNSNNAAAATSAGGSLAAARDAINGAVGSISNSVATAC